MCSRNGKRCYQSGVGKLAHPVVPCLCFTTGGDEQNQGKEDCVECFHANVWFVLRVVKCFDKRVAKGVAKVRALCGQLFTQAQHLMHRSAIVRCSCRGVIACVGQFFAQIPQCLHNASFTEGEVGMGRLDLRSLMTLKIKRNKGHKGCLGR